MKFKDKELGEFITLYEEAFGIKLEKADAEGKAQAVLSLVKLTYKPIKKNYEKE